MTPPQADGAFKNHNKRQKGGKSAKKIIIKSGHGTYNPRIIVRRFMWEEDDKV